MAGRLEVKAGKMVRKAGSESGQARVKTQRTSKRERKSRSTEKHAGDLTRPGELATDKQGTPE